jgi:GNAT superfamily N-acetyltransferase
VSFEWIHENPPHWDRRKAEIVGAAPAGVFAIGDYTDGDLIPGEWWRVEEDGAVLGYGWMDCTWAEAEILLVVDAAQQGRGVGAFILDRLEREAATRGLRYLQNVVREGHPDRERVTRWLQSRGFEHGHDDDRLMRRVGLDDAG